MVRLRSNRRYLPHPLKLIIKIIEKTLKFTPYCHSVIVPYYHSALAPSTPNHPNSALCTKNGQEKGKTANVEVQH